MVTIAEIRAAIHEKNYTSLRALHAKAKTDGIQFCDERQRSTVALQLLECSLFQGTSPGHVRALDAMLDAVERGNHPYDDEDASAVFLADAAIAQAQLDAMVGRRK